MKLKSSGGWWLFLAAFFPRVMAQSESYSDIPEYKMGVLRVLHQTATETSESEVAMQRLWRLKRASSASDREYDKYFERMKQVAQQTEQREVAKMLARQQAERAQLMTRFQQFHDQEQGTSKSPASSSGSSKVAMKQDRVVEQSTMDNSVPIDFEPLCTRFALTARLHCRGAASGRFARKCWHYFKDCESFVPHEDPLYPMAEIYLTMKEPAPPRGSKGSQEGDEETPSSSPLSSHEVDDACRRVLHTARKYCHGARNTAPDLRKSCWAFLRDCSRLIPKSDPLYRISLEAQHTDAPEAWAEGKMSSSAAAEEDDAGELNEQALQVLKKTCDRFLPTARLHCKSEAEMEERFKKRCHAYFNDCHRFVATTPSDPLYDIAHSFDGGSGVGLTLGEWAVKGLPYYPINEEGAFGAGYSLNIPFGAWGGGFGQSFGVRDYWSQFQEVGANWYEGKYGYKSGWTVPLVQSLGIEGDTHAVVSVPLKPGEFGKPVGVDVGGGVGPYYQQNQHVGVDWYDGQVNNNFGVGVPLAGVGFQTGTAVAFPGPAAWLG